jgi:hypothetical protein
MQSSEILILAATGVSQVKVERIKVEGAIGIVSEFVLSSA